MPTETSAPESGALSTASGRAGSSGPREHHESATSVLDRRELRVRVDAILNRHATVGLALGVVRNGSLEYFHGHGNADISSQTPVTPDTVFRICSITKVFTAIAVMQLWEQGLIDLEAPANDYLRAYQLIPAKANYRPATVRDLLTHTAGIAEVLHASDLLRPDWGESVKLGEPLPALAEFYQYGLRLDFEPGTAFRYGNHGFATLSQLVEDVSGQRFDRYLRDHIFEPLSMSDTDLVRSERIEARLATGYVLGSRGPKAVPAREGVTPGASNIYSTTRDMARFIAALLGGGANEYGSILKSATLATMFAPHYQPDPRLPGMGLGFFRHEAGGHRLVGHDGIMPGYNSTMFVAPDDGVGLIAFTSGAHSAVAWLPAEFGSLLGYLLDVPDVVARTDIPQHPEIWNDLCGRYELRARAIEIRARMIMGVGAQVFVRGGQLMLRMLSPIPALYRGFPLLPDDEQDPYVFRIDLSGVGMAAPRIVFSRDAGLGVTAVHLDLLPISLHKRSSSESAGPWLRRALPIGLGATTAIVLRHHAYARQRARAQAGALAGEVRRSRREAS